MTAIEKLWACCLPPSGVVKESEIVAVARELLATAVCIFTLHDMRMVLFSTSWELDSPPVEMPPCDDIKSSHKLLSECILRIGDKEMSGIPLLANILSYFVKAVNHNLVGTFAIDLEFVVLENYHTQGRKPASDVAILYKLEKGPQQRLLPRVLFEYKPKVHEDKDKVNGDQLIELLLQAHYCLATYKVASLLCCLTDMRVWHYFLIERLERKLLVKRGHTGHLGKDLKEDELLTNVSLIVSAIHQIDPDLRKR